MSSNVQPRPRPSGSGSSSSRTPQVVRSRPAAVATSSSSSSSNNNLITARPAVVSRNSSASVVTNASTTASIAVTTPGNGNKDTSSSAGKVFAKPSKEWVLPERAKPGRKVSAEEPDNVSAQPNANPDPISITCTPTRIPKAVTLHAAPLTLMLMAETPIPKPPIAKSPPGPPNRLHPDSRRAPAGLRSRRDPFQCPITRGGASPQGR